MSKDNKKLASPYDLNALAEERAKNNPKPQLKYPDLNNSPYTLSYRNILWNR